MNTVIIYGDKKDTELKNILLKLLSKKYNINYISDSFLNSLGGDRPLNIIETSHLNGINVKNAILIIKNNAKINSIKSIDKSTNIIVNANNIKNLICLAKRDKNVYTCGFSSKDYITFSSREDDNAIVSLQRSIKTINENVYEPMEIICNKVSNINDYSILAVILSLILLEIIDENKVNF